MYCKTCGVLNDDNNRKCISCGTDPQADPDSARAPSGSMPPPPVPTTTNIPNYLPQAILTTLCCCLPAGIVSIVFAAQVNGKIEAGNISGAMAASKNAKTWAWVSFALGFVVSGIYLAAAVISAASESGGF